MGLRNFAETYSNFSDDEILNLAVELNTLTEDARLALLAELARRNLTETNIAERSSYLSAVKPGKWPDKEEFVGRSFNGFGTAIYGQREFWPDGSFLTTKWIVLLWIPIIPLGSTRVKKIGRSGAAFPVGWSARYRVYSKQRPDVRQVLSVYGFIAALFLAVCYAASLPESVGVAMLGALCAVPWLVRKAAKARSSKTR